MNQRRSCSTCGYEVAGSAAFCSWCGTPVPGGPPAGRPAPIEGPPAPTPAPAGDGRAPSGGDGPPFSEPRAAGNYVVAGVVAALVIALVVVAALLITNRDRSSSDRLSTRPRGRTSANEPGTTAAAPTSTAPAVTVAPTPTTVPAGPVDLRAQPAALFCLDLQMRGYPYAAAVDYWRLHGQPTQMDADGNGIPCETIFTGADIASYWGALGRRPARSGLPAGLLCQGLRSRGASYAEAVAYWYAEGAPDRMDVDHNGIPCETVYPTSVVNPFWHG